MDKKKRVAWNKGKKTGIVPVKAFKKGRIPWNKGLKTGLVPKSAFKKGCSGFNKKHSEESKLKMKLANIGKRYSTKTEFKKGKHPWNKGLKGVQAGENSPRWLGGISFEPYGIEFNEDLKEVIRNRDRRKCFICKKTELEEGKRLAVHHIDYNKENNTLENLISLCASCHARTNYNRKKNTTFFKNSKKQIKEMEKKYEPK